MMSAGSPMSRRRSTSLNVPAHSPSPPPPPEPRDPPLTAPPLSPPPCWATQALCDLARGETELRRVRERQAAEVEAVSRGMERAVLGARREERRLLERVEQDHRDAQRQLEQLQRENAAAARVSQALLDQRLRKLAQLREQIQRAGQNPADQDPLLRGIGDLLQPWEISLSLKKVSFKPSSQPKAVTFGEIGVQEHDLCLPVMGCGPRGQLCPLHSGEASYGGDAACYGGAGEGRSTPDGAGPALGGSPAGSGGGGGGNLRVVRKIRLSARSDEESGGEELRLASPPKTRRWPPRRETSDRESSQDEELESPTFEPCGDNLFLAVPALLSNGDSEGEELGYKAANSDGRRHALRNQRKPRTLVLVSGREPSSPPEGVRGEQGQRWSLDSQDGDRGRARQNQSPRGGAAGPPSLTSPRSSPREGQSSLSCLDLSGGRGDRPRSRLLSVSSSEDPGPRAPSPADSLDSCYTFVVSSPRDRAASLNRAAPPRLSKSTADLTHKSRRPLIGDGRGGDRAGVWRVNRNSLSSASAAPARGPRVAEAGRTLSCPGHREHGYVQKPPQRCDLTGGPDRVGRSLSMSVIDGSSLDQGKGRRERGEPALLEMEEDGDPSSALQSRPGRLVHRFGKQGSGRADLTLPSGVHATPQGQLFVVDCGNARVQVTDPRGNVLQQVTVSASAADGSSRRCRNYFDVAVNAKGLIALSCAAERALLVFNRHGRLLQTFGGAGKGGAKDELEAPRGVTVTRLDEFLVADIRKGTLVALKLDPKTGCRLERTVVTGFHRPYLVAACLSSGLVAVSERGSETGREPCVKVLEPGWNTLRVLGVCPSLGPVLFCPWGICVDGEGNVLVADWGEQHRVVLYPAQAVGRPVVTQGLSSPRGLALLPEGHLVVSDSMHHCIKIYQYK